MTKIIIAGSRKGFTALDVDIAMSKALRLLKWLPCDIEVVSGTASGVDRLGEAWAAERNLPVIRFPAEWDKYGKYAGYKRNQQMADVANALVALWDGVSKGTNHMITIALAKGIPVHVYGPGAGLHQKPKTSFPIQRNPGQ